MIDYEIHESFLKKYATDLSLFYVYKNHVNNLVTEASVKIKHNNRKYNRYLVIILSEEINRNKIYNFVDELFEKQIFDSTHISRVYSFIDKYYSDTIDFGIGIDDGAYKLYYDLDGEMICLYLNKEDFCYKSYKKVNYIFPQSISLLNEYGLNLSHLPVRKVFKVSKLSNSIDNFEYIDKYQYGFWVPLRNNLFDHKIYWISTYQNEATFYLKPGCYDVINENPFTIKLSKF